MQLLLAEFRRNPSTGCHEPHRLGTLKPAGLYLNPARFLSKGWGPAHSLLDVPAQFTLTRASSRSRPLGSRVTFCTWRVETIFCGWASRPCPSSIPARRLDGRAP